MINWDFQCIYLIISSSLDVFLILGSLGLTQLDLTRFNSNRFGSEFIRFLGLTQLDLTRFDDRIVLDFLGFRFDSTKLDLTQLPVGTQR